MNNVGPGLIDLYGQPLRREQPLDKQVAAPQISGVRSIISGHPASGITPGRLASLLRRAEEGDAEAYFELAEQMEELDLHYNSVLGTRKRAVSQMPMEVEPADDSAEAMRHAEVIEQLIERDTIEAEIFDMLDAIGKGVSFVEMVWDLKSSLQLPMEFIWRQPSFFEFDRIDGTTPYLRGEGGQCEPLEPGKFIVHIHQAKSGLPIRGGIARSVAWGWMFKNYAIKDWVGFLEMYGQPLRTGRYDPGASEGDIRKLMSAVAQIGSDAAAVFPRTMDIEFIDSKAGTAPNELWRSFAEYIDDQVSKVVIGQTSSADAKASGIGSGQSDLHGEVRDDIARADAKLLAATLNRDLVRPIIDRNFGRQAKYPRIKIEKPDALDVKAMVDTAIALAGAGVEIDADDVREKAGMPAPKSAQAKLLKIPAQNSPQEAQEGKDAPMAGGKTPPALSGPSLRLKSANRTRGDNPDGDKEAEASEITPRGRPGRDDGRDAIDDLVDDVVDRWSDMFEEIVDPIEELLDGASSIGEIRNRLASHFQTMDDNMVTALLEKAGFATFVAGEVDVAREQSET
ncbi:MAG: DUF935 domain-containing protein [Sphingorhabdus sp.]